MLGLPPKALIAMIHVPALPGTPRGRLKPRAIVAQVRAEARVLVKAGFDAILIENMHDVPYVMGRQDPAVTACMTACALAVREEAPGLPLGVQILACGHHEALAVAHAAGATFIRVENFTFAHIADEGLMPTAEAGPLLRYRRAIDAAGVHLLCDVKKKHASHAITADITLPQACQACEFFGASGLVVTGQHTGDPASTDDLAEACTATGLPVFVGSGATAGNIAGMLAHADGVIVGSSIKRGGRWDAGPDPRRCAALVAAGKSARSSPSGRVAARRRG